MITTHTDVIGGLLRQLGWLRARKRRYQPVVQVRFSDTVKERRELVAGDRKQSQIESSAAARGYAVAQEHP